MCPPPVIRRRLKRPQEQTGPACSNDDRSAPPSLSGCGVLPHALEAPVPVGGRVLNPGRCADASSPGRILKGGWSPRERSLAGVERSDGDGQPLPTRLNASSTAPGNARNRDVERATIPGHVLLSYVLLPAQI